MTKKFISFIVVGIFFLLMQSVPAFAKISINSDFQGTVVITLPNGEIALIEHGDPIPDIPQGSTLEVFDGNFTVTTEQGDQCKVSCLEHTGTASNVGSINLSCGEESGLLKVVAGSVHMVDPSGKESDISAGTEYPVQATTGEQPPTTGATEPAGTLVSDGAPPPDSRSIESSPSK